MRKEKKMTQLVEECLCGVSGLQMQWKLQKKGEFYYFGNTPHFWKHPSEDLELFDNF